MIELVSVSPTIIFDVRYATRRNVLGRILYPSARVFLQEPVAYALHEVQQELESQGYSLKVFDGYRPHSVQKIMYDACPDEQKQYLADPAVGSNHNRGTAVDVTLVDRKTGQELVMPSEFDDFSPRAHRNYEQMASAEARWNCRLLESVMEKHGFIGLPHEWWHFDWKDSKKYPVLDISFDELERTARDV